MKSASSIRHLLRAALLTIVPLALCLTPGARAEDAVEIHLKPDATGMKFDHPEISVPAGKPVKLTFENVSPVPLPHNILIIKPGTLQKIGMMANAMLTDPTALAKGYIPESEDVLHHSKLLNPGEKETLEFTAPTEPGDYPFVCTFPGHWMLMQGVMKVTAE